MINLKKLRIVSMFLVSISLLFSFNLVAYGAKKKVRLNRGKKISRKIKHAKHRRMKRTKVQPVKKTNLQKNNNSKLHKSEIKTVELQMNNKNSKFLGKNKQFDGDIKNDGEFELSVWLTTVCNLDWPKKGEWNANEQKKRMCEILDDIKSKGISRVFFQVRPRGDAFYKSEVFPYSKFLTGEIGKEPDYDPLQFVCEECKNRGIKLEAWINPFLISNGAGYTKEEYINAIPDSNKIKSHPEWILELDNKKKILRMENSQVRDMIIKEAEYIIDHYNYISGIHIDDYFYPYPDLDGKDLPGEIYYDDVKEYEEYQKSCIENSFLSLEDWRRNNINQFIRSLGESCRFRGKAFSVSPFGIWKNVEDFKSGKSTNGMESYFAIYCDSLKWVKEGWIDLLVPQVYWEFGHPKADFEVLTNWWNDMFKDSKVKLEIGLAAYKVDPKKTDVWKDSGEIARQIEFCKKSKNISGVSFCHCSTMFW